MKLFRWLPLPAAAPLLLAACGGFGEAMTAHTDIVARAAGKEFRTEDAAALMGSNPQIPADPQVVRALADLWIDYTLLATAVAEDTSLAALDLEAFTLPVREQMIVMRLRDQVIRADTVFEPAEIEQRWATDGPGAEIRARHILLRVPAEATPQQRDSVRAEAEQVRARAAGGEDFAALATQLSQDPGSAVQGGDLGFFSRGRMVQPFEEAAFALQPGEVSEVVETPFGYHVIRLEERRQPELGEQREEFRQFLVQQSIQQAEAAYMDSLSTAANVEVRPGGLAVVREIASRPEAELRGRAAEREIATYAGGNFTSGELVEFLRTQDAQVQSMFANASEEQLEQVIDQLVRRELLLAQARGLNLELSQQEQDSIRAEARSAIRGLVESTGVAQIARQGANAQAIEEHVRSFLAAGIAGQAPLTPLGPLGYSLRSLYPHEINEGTFSQVLQQVEQQRASAPPQQQLPPGMQLPQGADPQGAPPQPQAPPQPPQGNP